MNDPQRIESITKSLGLGADDVEPVGWFKGKLALGLEQRLSNRPKGKYIDLTDEVNSHRLMTAVGELAESGAGV